MTEEKKPAAAPLAKTQAFVYHPMVKVGTPAGLRGLAEMMKSKIAETLPKHITPERVIKALFVAASKNPDLYECTEESICKSLMDASSLGLDCSGTLGSGYLIPFNRNTKDKKTGQWNRRKECQFIPGYRGLIDLARRGGQIATIEAHAVYTQDNFLLQYGTESKLVHIPNLQADRKEEFLCFYAVATLRDGTKQLEVMTLADVERIRDAAMAKNHQEKPSGPWADHFAEMGRKTVVRRLCKYLPLSPELEKAFAIEDRNSPEMIDVKPIERMAPENIPTGRMAFGFTQPVADDAPPTNIDPETGEETPVNPDTAAEAERQKAALEAANHGGAPSAEEQKAIADREAREAGQTTEPEDAPNA